MMDNRNGTRTASSSHPHPSRKLGSRPGAEDVVGCVTHPRKPRLATLKNGPPKKAIVLLSVLPGGLDQTGMFIIEDALGPSQDVEAKLPEARKILGDTRHVGGKALEREEASIPTL